MINMVVNHGFLRSPNGSLHSMKLLHHIDALFLSFNHGHHLLKMATSAFETLEGRRMRLVNMGGDHG
jgi:hypothetical protein